ncbi:MAG: hypothetical protein ACKPKO_44935, partial [Candidatus Fonsibacter sp.]
PSEGSQGGALDTATPNAKAKPKAKAKYDKPTTLVNNTIEENIELSKLPPGQQALLPKTPPNNQGCTSKEGQEEEG